MSDDKTVPTPRSVQAPIATPVQPTSDPAKQPSEELVAVSSSVVSDGPKQQPAPVGSNATPISGATKQQPTAPVSAPKEHEPAPTPDVKAQEVPNSPEISKELKEIGVEQGSDAKEHDIPKELQKVGVQLAKESTKVDTAPSDDAKKLPMSYAQAVEIQKTKSVKDSVKWLATFIMYQWKKLQQPKSQIQE